MTADTLAQHHLPTRRGPSEVVIISPSLGDIHQPHFVDVSCRMFYEISRFFLRGLLAYSQEECPSQSLKMRCLITCAFQKLVGNIALPPSHPLTFFLAVFFSLSLFLFFSFFFFFFLFFSFFFLFFFLSFWTLGGSVYLSRIYVKAHKEANTRSLKPSLMQVEL